MSSFKELNGPLGTEFHSFFSLEGESDTCPSLGNTPQSSNSSYPTRRGESFIPFDQSVPQKFTLESCGEKGAVQHLRATMPDQTRCIVNASLSNLSGPINIVNKAASIDQKEQQSERPHYTPITNAILQQQASSNSRGSPRVIRRYSKPQGDSCDSDTDAYPESSVDGEQDDTVVILKKFQDSVQGSDLSRRRSSPDLIPDLAGFRFSSNKSSNNTPTIASSGSSIPPPPVPVANSKSAIDYPRQTSILSKMVGSRFNSQQQEQQQQNVDNAVTQTPGSLTPSKSCPKFHSFEDDFHQHQYIDIYSVQQNCPKQSGAMVPCPPESSLVPSRGASKRDFNIDSLDSNASSSSGFGFLSKTRKFGTWLGLSADGAEKMEISKKDLNVFAPTTF